MKNSRRRIGQQIEDSPLFWVVLSAAFLVTYIRQFVIWLS